MGPVTRDFLTLELICKLKSDADKPFNQFWAFYVFFDFGYPCYGMDAAVDCGVLAASQRAS